MSIVPTFLYHKQFISTQKLLLGSMFLCLSISNIRTGFHVRYVLELMTYRETFTLCSSLRTHLTSALQWEAWRSIYIGLIPSPSV